jgi:hypothetical protein
MTGSIPTIDRVESRVIVATWADERDATNEPPRWSTISTTELTALRTRGASVESVRT